MHHNAPSPTIWLLFFAALAVVGSTAAAAPGKQDDPQKRFARKDTNSDGFLTLEEFKAGMPQPKE